MKPRCPECGHEKWTRPSCQIAACWCLATHDITFDPTSEEREEKYIDPVDICLRFKSTQRRCEACWTCQVRALRAELAEARGERDHWKERTEKQIEWCREAHVAPHEEHCKRLVAERIAEEYRAQDKGCESHGRKPLTWCDDCLAEDEEDSRAAHEAAMKRIGELEAGLEAIASVGDDDKHYWKLRRCAESLGLYIDDLGTIRAFAAVARALLAGRGEKGK